MLNFSRGAPEANIVDARSTSTTRRSTGSTRSAEGDAKTPFVDAPHYRGPWQFSWDRINKAGTQGIRIEFAPAGNAVSTYRPFTKEHAHFGPQIQQLNNCTARSLPMFPTPVFRNVGYHVAGEGL